METLIGLGLKSLLIAGVTLALLYFTRRRSAADRSWIAHLGLFALVALPIASLALPALSVEIPASLQAEAPAPLSAAVPAELVDPPFVTTAPAVADPVAAIDWTPYAYAIPAIALLLVTMVALLRLFGLRGRAQVLVDPIWLSALAHAQGRMGFKNGTALLTSSELSSPISWGLMRPVILLNDEALAASGEAEAIIAHELAHVARLDWAKLLLARVATAIFWFNPLAWVLAREAHQLREEAADDAVLGANIADTDYAQLLVGVARHECRGLLLGAHGISPGRGSLKRCVSRVLDTSLARSSGGRSWVAGFAAGMLVMAAPLAALTFAPKAKDRLKDEDVARADEAASAARAATAGASTTATAGSLKFAETPQAAEDPKLAYVLPFAGQPPIAALPSVAESVIASPDGSRVETHSDGRTVVRRADSAIVTTQAHDKEGRSKVIIRDANGSTLTYSEGRNGVGASPDYLAQVRRVAPHLGGIDGEDAMAMRALGVTPRFIQDLAAAGFANLDEDELIGARAIGVDGQYIRSMAAAGVRGSLDDYVEMRALRINARDAVRARSLGVGPLTAGKLVRIKTREWHGRARAPALPHPPEPPEPPEDHGPDSHAGD